MSLSSSRLLVVFGLSTLILIYAAGAHDRELVHYLVRRLAGPLLVLLLVGFKARKHLVAASPVLGKSRKERTGGRALLRRAMVGSCRE